MNGHEANPRRMAASRLLSMSALAFLIGAGAIVLLQSSCAHTRSRTLSSAPHEVIVIEYGAGSGISLVGSGLIVAVWSDGLVILADNPSRPGLNLRSSQVDKYEVEPVRRTILSDILSTRALTSAPMLFDRSELVIRALSDDHEWHPLVVYVTNLTHLDQDGTQSPFSVSAETAPAVALTAYDVHQRVYALLATASETHPDVPSERVVQFLGYANSPSR